MCLNVISAHTQDKESQKLFTVCEPLNINHLLSSTESVSLILKLVATQQRKVGNSLAHLLFCVSS